MKILWLCNIRLPHISEYLKLSASPLGGWLTGMSNALISEKFADFVMLFPNGETSISGDTGKMKFYGFSKSDIGNQFEEILKNEKPDIIHIFGTEFAHTLDMVNACEKLNLLDSTIINIQGLVSIYEDHYYADLPNNAINAYTFRDFIRRDNIKQQAKKFGLRGQKEVVALKKVRHVIGRTDWDRACTTQINPEVKYHFCNETLRDSFYEHSWSIDDCERNSIFISQAQYPIKGFHHVLDAMPTILSIFPNTHIYVTGKNPLDVSGMEKMKQSYYQRYIGRLIVKYNLRDKVTFLGSLNEEEIRKRFMKSHVFISPSSIENESNSLSEAKILGVPCVASFVGGVTNRIAHNIDGFLYQHDATYMLSYYVSQIFLDDTLARKLSSNARVNAKNLHDKKVNLNALKGIYNSLHK